MVGVVLIVTALCAQPDAPTPLRQLERGLAMLDLTDQDVLYDLGCGDGRVCALAAKRYGCRAVGVDYDLGKVRLARQVVRMNNLSPHVLILHGDVRQVNLDRATIVYVYLPEKLLAELAPKFEGRDLRVLSYLHRLPGIQGEKRHSFYFYQFSKPQGNNHAANTTR